MKLEFTSKITLENIPRPWISRFELYYPDLPGFPTVYVHFVDGKRVYGFPTAVTFEDRNAMEVDAQITFLSNVDLNTEITLQKHVKTELMERFGLSNKVGWQDIKDCCKGDLVYEKFFEKLWASIKKMNGDFLPYGRFYEELFSIVRFVSAWNPKTGRQSEMRMVYNFMSIFGEECEFTGDALAWTHLNFFVIPTYDDLIKENFGDFLKFQLLYKSCKKIWNEQSFPIEGSKFPLRGLKRGWPAKKDDFMIQMTRPLIQNGVMTEDEAHSIERLVDAFNRNGTRTSFFVWGIMSAKEAEFHKWDKDFFVDFYVRLSEKGKGMAPKVVACYLQQGFGNEECIPIDIWVKTFHEHALGISDKEEFLKKFEKMGKLERAIWFACQAKKTNIVGFFDTLWCVRYGNNGNKSIRGANPLSCYECTLIHECAGYDKIKQNRVLVLEESSVKIKEIQNYDDETVNKLETGISKSEELIQKYKERVNVKIREKQNLESEKNNADGSDSINKINEKIERLVQIIESSKTNRSRHESKVEELRNKIEVIKSDVDRVIHDADVLGKFLENNCMFVCLTNDAIPKKIYMPKYGKNERSDLNLVDEFSGYVLKGQKSGLVGKATSVMEFIKDMPEPNYSDFRQAPVDSD